MNKFTNALAIICFSFFGYSGFANANSALFFESNGKEVEVSYSGSYRAPTTVAFSFVCPESYCDLNSRSVEVTKDFIKAVRHNQVYRYVPSQPSCNPLFPCEVINSEPYPADDNNGDFANLDQESYQTNSRGQKETARNVAVDMATSAGNKIIDRGIDLIFDEFAQDARSGTPSFYVLSRNSQQPILICEVTSETGCTIVDEVAFGEIENGFSIDINILAADTLNARTIAIREALASHSRAIKYECITVSTGIHGGRLSEQITCYYRP